MQVFTGLYNSRQNYNRDNTLTLPCFWYSDISVTLFGGPYIFVSPSKTNDSSSSGYSNINGSSYLLSLVAVEVRRNRLYVVLTYSVYSISSHKKEIVYIKDI